MHHSCLYRLQVTLDGHLVKALDQYSGHVLDHQGAEALLVLLCLDGLRVALDVVTTQPLWKFTLFCIFRGGVIIYKERVCFLFD